MVTFKEVVGMAELNGTTHKVKGSKDVYVCSGVIIIIFSDKLQTVQHLRYQWLYTVPTWWTSLTDPNHCYYAVCMYQYVYLCCY